MLCASNEQRIKSCRLLLLQLLQLSRCTLHPLMHRRRARTHTNARTDEELWQQQQVQQAQKMPQLTQDAQSSSAGSGESTYYSDYHSTLPKPQVRNTLNHLEQAGVVTRTRCEVRFFHSQLWLLCALSHGFCSLTFSSRFFQGCTRLTSLHIFLPYLSLSRNHLDLDSTAASL